MTIPMPPNGSHRLDHEAGAHLVIVVWHPTGRMIADVGPKGVVVHHCEGGEQDAREWRAHLIKWDAARKPDAAMGVREYKEAMR
jgi:hypothetical protein